ncbi:hypothetical protein HJC23_007317 [Cyclotella cryptica]|uniref:Guanylate cyclase domain-containing protein n=1 Tax=Cyclotella cryptica TaxID=29204 RepID=A0ABD3NX86_9STRA
MASHDSSSVGNSAGRRCDEGGSVACPPQDQSISLSSRPAPRRSTSVLSLDMCPVGDNSDAPTEDDGGNGDSHTLSGLRTLGYENNDMAASNNEYDESDDDEMAQILTQLMKNHSRAVAVSLVERSALVQSIIWLSRHVPGCVLEHLFETVLRQRYALKAKSAHGMISGDMNINLGGSLDFAPDNSDVQHIQPLNDSLGNDSNPIISFHDLSLPIAKTQESALLFVDMSVGMSRASIRLENVRPVQARTLRGSVKSAPDQCRQKASMTSEDSSNDGQIPRSSSIDHAPIQRSLVGHASKPIKLATLNVKCGVGVGKIVGVHVGNDAGRREYLILGSPIDQVASAEEAATTGKVFASPEALAVLSRVASLKSKCEHFINDNKPMCIAERHHLELLWLKNMISLCVHPVVVNDENESHAHLRRESDDHRHRSEAELRNVYVIFISPLIEYRLTGDEAKDRKLINLLNDIMNLTAKHLDRVKGHLRQFIVDDKGVVLICTFGLRGSTFPNMISQRALPVTRSIHDALQEELGMKSKIGGTFGRAYCGVVGGLTRHEFAVLSPSVNLVARIMASKFNPGILVDKNVRLLTSQTYFKRLPPVNAKGYDEPVPIFEPIKSNDTKWGKVVQNFIGRSNEIKHIMQVAKGMALNTGTSKFVLVSAASGTGKSCMIVQVAARVRAMAKKMNKYPIVTRHISNQGDSRVPFRTVGQFITEFELVKRQFFSTDANQFLYICEQLNAPPEFVEVVGKRLLGMKNLVAATVASGTPNSDSIVDFLADAFIRCTKHADLVVLALDDAHEMDQMSWKVVQAIFKRGENVLVLCCSRPPSTNPSAVDPGFWAELHHSFSKKDHFVEINLQPLSECEVRDLVAVTLNLSVNDIDTSFWHNIFNTTGGMPHYLSYALELIKRQELFTRLGNGLIGLKKAAKEEEKVSLGFGSVSELLLYRLDALDSSVRNVLHLAAVLGTEFELVDAALAYDEMHGVRDFERSKTALALREAFDLAVEEGIIEESYASSGNDEEDVDDPIEAQTSLCASLGNIKLHFKGYRKTHPAYSENQRYRFTHDSWKIIMLEERIQECCNSFRKRNRRRGAAELALKIGGQLMLLGLNAQSILLFDNVLNTLKDLSAKDFDEMHGGISVSMLNAIEAAELENLIKLNVAKGKAYSTLGKAKEGAEAMQMQSALDILQYSPCADDEHFDRSVSFLIFSGLFVVLKMGAIEDDDECSYEKDLTEKFIEQTRLNKDPVHYGRALAMQGETLGKLGRFEEALKSLEQIKPIYNIKTQHKAICKSCGSDRVAQAYTHMNGAPLEARVAFESFVVEPFEEHFGKGGTTFSKPLFITFVAVSLSKVLLFFSMLLDLQGRQDEQIERIDEYLEWALNESNFALCSDVLELAWAAISVSPNSLLGEICYYLARMPEGFKHRDQLIKSDLILSEKSVEASEKLPFANRYARRKLDVLQKFHKDQCRTCRNHNKFT